LLNVVHRNFNNSQENEVKPISNYGMIYPELVKYPAKYIQPQPELKTHLATLRSHGKKLFLTTNKHIEFLELTMKETLGRDWKDFFDIIVANCRKPLFYKSENPFFEVRDST
jgi:phosphoglycolate phosphatase-like HAD superfamily hydrolase